MKVGCGGSIGETTFSSVIMIGCCCCCCCCGSCGWIVILDELNWLRKGPPAVILTMELTISGVLGVCEPSWAVVLEGTCKCTFKEIFPGSILAGYKIVTDEETPLLLLMLWNRNIGKGIDNIELIGRVFVVCYWWPHTKPNIYITLLYTLQRKRGGMKSWKFGNLGIQRFHTFSNLTWPNLA